MEPAEINAHLVEDNILLRNRVDTLQRQLGLKEQRLAEAEAQNEDYQARLREIDKDWTERMRALDDAQARLRAIQATLTTAIGVGKEVRSMFPGHGGGSQAWEQLADNILRMWFSDNRTASSESPAKK